MRALTMIRRQPAGAGVNPQSARLPRASWITGRRFDEETGLYFYRARAYSPTPGRFLQTDPIGSKGEINLYAYVGNNPINATDPNGHFGMLSFVGVGIGVAGVACAVLEPCGAIAVAGAGGIAVINAPMALDSLAIGSGALLTDSVFSEVPPIVGPGPFAGDSVPAGPSARPTGPQPEQINGIGDASDCHTCGTSDPGTTSGNWIGDHQPPTALNPDGSPPSVLSTMPAM